MPEIATRITRVILDAERTISSGSIKVYGIQIANGTASNIIVQFLDSSDTNLLDIAVLAHDAGGWDVPWIASNGLKIASQAATDVVVTVAHSSDGA